MGDDVGLKVFISWSGKRGHAMAEVVQKWLGSMIQMCEPWLSSEDLRAGSGWRRRLEDSLRVTSTGILCLTPASQSSPWLLFEAGSLSKTEDEAVCPLLVPGMAKSELREPLSSFQATSADSRDEVFKLARTINARLPEKGGRLSDEKLRYAFEREWPAFEASMREAASVAEVEVKARSEPDKQDEMLTLLRGIERQVVLLRAEVPDIDTADIRVGADGKPYFHSPRGLTVAEMTSTIRKMVGGALNSRELGWVVRALEKAQDRGGDQRDTLRIALEEVQSVRDDEARRREERTPDDENVTIRR